MTETITCPSGLSGAIRGMKVREERILADRKLAKAGTQLDQLLAACWDKTLDPGPYTFGDRPDWSQVLQGDRFYTVLRLRILTYGPEYAFAVTCENEACRQRIEWELDLRALPVRTLSPESRAAFAAGNHFETVLPDSGMRVHFRLPIGADEQRLAQLKKDDRPLSAVLALRVTSIDTPEARDIRAILEDLSLGDADFLLDEMDRVDCGVDTRIQIQCPHCGMVQEVDLPFDRTFFLPARGRTSRTRAPITCSRT